jgi:hypothetical protein
MPKRLTLHIGAHKTATTRLQSILHTNTDRLDAAGLHYVPTRKMGMLVRPDFRRAARGRTAPDAAGDAIGGRIRAHTGDADHTLISFENALGGVDDLLLDRPAPYHQADALLGSLSQAFAGYDARLFLSVRSYAGFYNSAYSELARQGNGVPADQVAARMKAFGFSWVDLVKRVQAQWPGTPVTIWKYEDYRDNEPAILSRLTGLPEDTGWTIPDADARPAISATAARALVALGPPLQGLYVQPQVTAALAEAFPVTGPKDAIRLFTKTQEKPFDKAYRADLKTLAAMDGVDLVGF